MATVNLGQVSAFFSGTSAPTNTSLVWQDISTTPAVHKVYDSTTSMWRPLGDFTLDSRTITINGTTDRIAVTGGTQDLGADRTWTVNLATTYAGQTSITTLGTIATGTWQGSVISETYLDSSLVRDSRTVTVNGTTNEVEVTGGTQDLSVNRTWTIGLPDDVTIGGNLTVTGDFTVNGTNTAINVTNLTTTDPLIHGADENPNDTLDLGAYWSYNFSTTETFSGIFRDNSDANKAWTFFDGLTEQPTTTVNTAGAGYSLANIIIAEPTVNSHGATKLYVDTQTSTISQPANQIAYGTGTGLTSSANLTFNGSLLSLTGTETITGQLNIDSLTLDGTTISSSGDLVVTSPSNTYLTSGNNYVDITTTDIGIYADDEVNITSLSGNITLNNFLFGSTISTFTGGITLAPFNSTTSITGMLSISNTTNQLVLGTTNTTTINATAPVSSVAYTIPDKGGNDTFAFLSDISGISSFSVTNEADNRIITSTGSGTGNAESNLTFDGASLTNLTGGTYNTNLNSFGLSGLKSSLSAFTLAIDGFGVGVSSAFGIRGISRSTQAAINVVGEIATGNDTGTIAATTISSWVGSSALSVRPTLAGYNLNTKQWQYDADGTYNIYKTTNQLVLGTTNTTTLNSVAPAASRVYNIPDFGSNDTFVGLAATQTLTNKTLTSPIISQITNSSGDITLTPNASNHVNISLGGLEIGGTEVISSTRAGSFTAGTFSGNVDIQRSVSGPNSLFLNNSNAGAGAYDVIRLGVNTTAAVGLGIHHMGSNYTESGLYAPDSSVIVGFESPGLRIASANASGALRFYTGGSSSTNLRMYIDSGGDVGIGTSSPSAKLHSLATTEQLRIGYDASNYMATTVASDGGVTFNTTGTSPDFTFSDNVIISGDLTADSVFASNIPLDVTVDLTASQINNSGTTPIELIAAPGAGQYIVVLSAIFSIDFNTTAYTLGTTGPEIRYSGGNLAVKDVTFIRNVLTATADAAAGGLGTEAITYGINEAVRFDSNGDNHSLGDSPGKVYLIYIIRSI